MKPLKQSEMLHKEHLVLDETIEMFNLTTGFGGLTQIKFFTLIASAFDFFFSSLVKFWDIKLGALHRRTCGEQFALCG